MKHSVKNKIISLVMAGAMATAVGAVSASAQSLSPTMLITNNAVTAGIQNAKSDLGQIHAFVDDVKNGNTEYAQTELGTLMTTAKYRKSQLPFAGYSKTYGQDTDLLSQAYSVGKKQAEADNQAIRTLKQTGDVNQFAKTMGTNVGESLGAAKDIAKNQADQILKTASSLQTKYGDPRTGLKTHSYSASYLPQGSLLNLDNENSKLPNLFENTGIMQKVGNQIRPYSSTGYDSKKVKWGSPVKLDNGYVQQNYLQKKGNKNIITSVYTRPLKNGSTQIWAESSERNTKKERNYHPVNHIGSASHPITVKKGQNPISAIFNQM